MIKVTRNGGHSLNANIVAGNAMLCGNSPQATTPIYSLTGQWIAFVTPDNRVWRPDSELLGHLVDGNVYNLSGAYVGTISHGVLSRLAGRSGMNMPLPVTPVVVPGYPGIPEPSHIRPLAPGETLLEKLIVH